MYLAALWGVIATTVLSLLSQLYTRLPYTYLTKLGLSPPFITPGTSNYINELLQQWNSSGLAVAVVRRCGDNDTCWIHEFGSYGIARDDGTAMTPDTLLAIASNSKLFLAISVGLLISNESLSEELGYRLDWGTRISDIIPEWGLMDEYASRSATIQDLLSHRTGLPRHDFSKFPYPEGPLGTIKTLRTLRPSAGFRETFQYNNLMYITLSYLPQVLLNQSYASYVSEHLLKPLGMASTTFSLKDAYRGDRFAHGYISHMRDLTMGYNGTKVATSQYYIKPGDEAADAGPGGVISSARDMAVWISMLMNKGRHPYDANRTVVPEAVIEHIARGITISAGVSPYPELSPKVYGAAQFRYSYQGHDIIEHGGSNPGYMSQVARFPNDNLGIITLSNDDDGASIVESVKWRIAEDIIGLDKVDWNSRYVELQQETIREMKPTPRPPSPVPPSRSFQKLASKSFHHPAYGTLSPCLITPHEDDSLRDHPDRCYSITSSTAVKQILSATNLSIPTLIMPWERNYATHIRLTHFTENVFNASMIWTNSEVLFGLDNRFEVEWVHHPIEGLAFKGNFWGKVGVDSKAPEGSGSDSAEVWFEAVDV